MSELLNVKQLARSKQRHSFNKDRQHSRRGRGAGRGGRGVGDVGQTQGRHSVSTVTDADGDSEEDEEDVEGRVDTSKFRRRRIVSQDKQFDVNENELLDVDDEIPKVDIDNLIKPMTATVDANFKLPDEHEWNFAGKADTTITIDCSKIAQKLNTLSMSHRLKLDLSPFGNSPLEEPNPFNVKSILKTISIHHDFTYSSIPHSTSQKKHATPEDSFLDDLLSASHLLPTSPTNISTSSTNPSTPVTPVIPVTPISPKPTSFVSSSSSIVKPPNLPPSTLNSPSTSIPMNDVQEKHVEDATKASVEDLEDWLDSVI